MRLAVVPLAGGEPRTLADDVGPLAARARSGCRTAAALLVTADDDGRGPDLPDRPRRPTRSRGDQRRRRVHGRAASARTAPRRTRCGRRTRRRATRCGSTWRRRRDDRAAEPGRDRPRCPARSTEVETTTDGRPACRGWLALPAARRQGPAAPVDPRRAARLVERVVVAVEPVAARRAGLRGAAARPGAVDRLRPAVHPGRLGRVGRGAVHRPARDHRRGRGSATTSTRRARRRWAARSAGTWPTGWPATPTGSRRSSRTRACGRWTSSARRRTRRSTGRREMTEQMALDNSPHRHVEKIVTPMLVVHGDKDYRVPIGEGLRLWYELLSKQRAARRRRGQDARTGSCTSPTRTTGCSARSTRSSGTRWSRRSWPSTCSARTA